MLPAAPHSSPQPTAPHSAARDTARPDGVGTGGRCPHPKEGLIPQQPAGTAEMLGKRTGADGPPAWTSRAK